MPIPYALLLYRQFKAGHGIQELASTTGIPAQRIAQRLHAAAQYWELRRETQVQSTTRRGGEVGVSYIPHGVLLLRLLLSRRDGVFRGLSTSRTRSISAEGVNGIA